jgi:hypothetical protein
MDTTEAVKLSAATRGCRFIDILICPLKMSKPSYFSHLACAPGVLRHPFAIDLSVDRPARAGPRVVAAPVRLQSSFAGLSSGAGDAGSHLPRTLAELGTSILLAA